MYALKLPILNEMTNEELREQVIDTWTLYLQLNGFNAISEIPGSAFPGRKILRTQTQHILAVAYNFVGLFDRLERIYNTSGTSDIGFEIANAVLDHSGKVAIMGIGNELTEKARAMLEQKNHGRVYLLSSSVFAGSFFTSNSSKVFFAAL